MFSFDTVNIFKNIELEFQYVSLFEIWHYIAQKQGIKKLTRQTNKYRNAILMYTERHKAHNLNALYFAQ